VVTHESHVEIVGHRGNMGSRECNEKLSLRRAESVKKWLVERGIPREGLITTGAGYCEPLACDGGPARRVKNRWIEF
jgi:OOP family OmpA-OmpF porin